MKIDSLRHFIHFSHWFIKSQGCSRSGMIIANVYSRSSGWSTCGIILVAISSSIHCRWIVGWLSIDCYLLVNLLSNTCQWCLLLVSRLLVLYKFVDTCLSIDCQMIQSFLSTVCQLVPIRSQVTVNGLSLDCALLVNLWWISCHVFVSWLTVDC